MAEYLIQDTTLQGIADSIRSKTKKTNTIPVSDMATEIDGISTEPTLQSKTVSPSSSTQMVMADRGYDGLSSVTVNAMPSGSAKTPATTITANPSLSTTLTEGSGYKMSVSATKSVTPTVSAGYISSGTAGTITVSGSAYVHAGSCSVAGGALSGGSAVTPSVTLSNGSDTNMSNVTAGSKDTTNYPYYFKVNAASSAGSSTVSRAAVTDTHTAGYIPQKDATTVIGADSKTVTVNASSGSTYVGLKKATFSTSANTVKSSSAGYIASGETVGTVASVSGSIGGTPSSGSATAAINNVNSMNTITNLTNKTAGTDYFTVKATATGTAGGYTPKYTVSTPGYIGSTVTGNKQTVSVGSDLTGKSIHVPKASFAVDGRSVKVTSTGGGYVKDGTTVGTISDSYIIPSGTK